MKKHGFWNYTEPITYKVVAVRILPVKTPVLHWQNAFVDEVRQAIEITQEDGTRFYLDNEDGSGLEKILSRGGPNSMSRHIANGAFIIVAFVPEHQWNELNGKVWEETDVIVDTWQKQHYPEEYARMKAMQAAWEKSLSK